MLESIKMSKQTLILKITLYTFLGILVGLLLYFGSYYVLYHLNGEWAHNKYNRYYFDGDKNYISTGWRYSLFHDDYPEQMESVEFFFGPCLIYEEIYRTKPCNADQENEVKHWRSFYPQSLHDDETGFVYNSYGRVYMHTINIWGRATTVHAPKSTRIW